MIAPATRPAATARPEQSSVVPKPRAKIAQFSTMTETSNFTAAPRSGPVHGGPLLEPAGRAPEREAHDEVERAGGQPQLDRPEGGGDDLLGGARQLDHRDDGEEGR